jgi:general secretion pathway protein L
MTTLRVLVTQPPGSEREAAWAQYDSAGVCVANGRDMPSRWPAADRLELVIAAAHVRVASLTLPPLPPARVATAAAFALEDQLAGPLAEQALAVGAQEREGRVNVAIVGRAWLSDVIARAAALPGRRLARIIAEPDLAGGSAQVRWCVPADRRAGTGFIRLADGSAFALAIPAGEASAPAELALVLARAGKGGAAAVRVDAEVADATLARWQRESGMTFARGTPWRWHEAAAARFDAAIDLLQGDLALASAPAAGSVRRWFVPALTLAAIALALHIVATVGEWAWWRIDAWRSAQTWRSLAAATGTTISASDSPAMMRAALLKRYAQQRHAQGLPAPSDALPLLARAAPALGALPPGALKSATYADGHWTLDLQPLDAAALRDLSARLQAAGTPAIAATTAAGTRLRLGADG